MRVLRQLLAAVTRRIVVSSRPLFTDPDKDPKQCRKQPYSFSPAQCSLHFPARHQIFRRQVSRL
jgi:hypothetical protein